MPTATYIALANTTLTGTTGTVTFSSIPATYRDLVVVHQGTSNSLYTVRFNGDSGSNYSRVWALGNGSTTNSGTSTDAELKLFSVSTRVCNVIFSVMDYSATDKHKTVLSRGNDAGAETIMIAGRWASTSAITSLALIAQGGNFVSGDSFALYGIIS